MNKELTDFSQQVPLALTDIVSSEVRLREMYIINNNPSQSSKVTVQDKDLVPTILVSKTLIPEASIAIDSEAGIPMIGGISIAATVQGVSIKGNYEAP